MNDLQQVTQLEVEINYYKNQTVQNFLEIGKRLVKSKEVIPNGEWKYWLKEKVDFTERTAYRLIDCYNRFGELSTSTVISSSKMIELLSLPEEKTQDFIENNDVQDMTVKQLREAVKREKEAIKREEQAKNEIAKLKTELEKQPREVIKEVVRTEKIEVTPIDYEPIKRDLASKDEALKKASYRQEQEVKARKQIEAELKATKEEMQKLKNEYTSEEAKNRFSKNLSENTIVFLSEMNNFLSRIGGLAWVTDYIEDLEDIEVRNIHKGLDSIEAWTVAVRNNLIEKGK
ncbi:DUF3102 domain-containing protein [Peptostreptococcus equinus]|uniref:DUF3102 domain-containing protein n=1 Tax=Peptostreptococcus equinus TaxID=3003601 RepID=A0ABY7JPG1_9FIRM|nr:DUF3102 domain-containing protein [Peptostreptococcus sp. CBA3647]WAW15250.1 DUF3102 domain-containing protein [Peptostreptococcus sp. CBA3647]